MRNKLLKRLRKEAKECVYLEPWKFDGPNVTEVIVVKEYACINHKYLYGKAIRWYDKLYTFQDVETLTGCNIDQGYSLEEGLKRLKEVRRGYIISLIEMMKKERREKEENKRNERARKLLSKY